MTSRLAHYEILGPLGKGGMGEVFEARDTRLDRRVALKVLPPELAADADRLERFRREARAVAALNHPNIVTLYSVEEAEGRHFLTMELVEGATLGAQVSPGGLPVAELLDLAQQIADALRAAHQRGVAHRDLKPANIMVDRDGRVRVLDFGLAKVRRGDDGDGGSGAGSSDDDRPTEQLTQAGMVMGTAPYMSPEQVQGRLVDAPSDLFSLGIVLYELATGRRPFLGASTAELVSAILRDDPPPIERAELPAELERLLRRCLEKDAAQRCTAVELLDALRALRGDLGSGVAPDEGPISGIAAPPPERPTLIGRDTEAERLRQLLAETAAGRGALALVTGEEGVGKTRLIHEVCDQARGQGVLVLFGRCRDMEGAQPYLPLIEQIEGAARLVSPRALRRALGPNAPEVAKLMPELRQRFTDIPEPVSLPPDQERRYVMHGVAEFIERAARVQPLILIYEDLHWADDSTLLLLRHLAARLREMPVLVLASYRDTELRPGSPLAAVVEDLTRERLAEEVRIKRLGRDDVAALIADRAHQSPPDELVSLVYAETEGNPFFVEEVYRHLLETGQIVDKEGRWRSGIHRAGADVPRSVGLAIGQRLERVSADCRTALTAAAVVGRTFRFDVLARVVSGLDEDRLLDAVEEAEAAALIAESSSGREARYGFANEQIRQTLLAGLSSPRRQRLHLRVADALEAVHGSRAERRATELAHHLYEAGAAADAGRTFRYLLLAAQSNRDALAFEDALRLLDAAQDVVDEGNAEDRSRLLFSRGLTLRSLARMEEALEALGQAIESEPSAALCDEILAARARLLLDQFRGREAAADLERLLATARAAGDRPRELECLIALGRAHYVLSLDDPEAHAQASRDTYEQAHAVAAELGDRRAMARALIPTGWFTDYWRDYYPQAVANLAEARRLAVEIRDQALELEVRSQQIRLLPAAQARAESAEVRRLLEARRDPVPLKELYFLMMWSYWSNGELERCREVCDAGIALARELGAEPVQYPTIKALALIDLGRFDAAWESLQAEVADDGHRFGRCMQRMGIAIYELRMGAWERAAETALWTLREATALKRIWMTGWMIDVLRSLAARLPERAAAIRAELGDRDARSYFRAFPELGAETLLLEGDPDGALAAARKAAQRAVDVARIAITSREVELRALAALGRDDELMASSQSALELADAAGADTWVWRLRALRALALARLGRAAEAGEERRRALTTLDRVRATIPQPELRASFEAEELAARLIAAGAG